MLSGQVDRKYLVEYGLELLADYNLLPDEAEYQRLAAFVPTIETDFLGFGNTYALAVHHLAGLAGVQTVVDIGCAWGLFSYLFRDYNYIGLEEYPLPFCRYYDHHRFIQGAFPFVSVPGDVFIASMSLGYGGRFYRENRDGSLNSLLLSELSRFRYGYYYGDPGILRLLSTIFDAIPIGPDNSRVYFLQR